MSIRRIAIISLFSLMLLAFPLIANAATFFNISGIAKGTATFTFRNMSSTGQRTNNIVKLTGGTVNAAVDAGDVVVVDDSIFKAAIGDPALIVRYPGNAGVAFTTDGYTLLLNKANGASGISRWYMQFPTDDYIANHAGSGTQYNMYGSCRINIAVNPNTGKGVMKASQMTPGEAWFWTYTSDGLGGVTNGDPVTTDAKASMPALNLLFIQPIP